MTPQKAYTQAREHEPTDDTRAAVLTDAELTYWHNHLSPHFDTQAVIDHLDVVNPRSLDLDTEEGAATHDQLGRLHRARRAHLRGATGPEGYPWVNYSIAPNG